MEDRTHPVEFCMCPLQIATNFYVSCHSWSNRHEGAVEEKIVCIRVSNIKQQMHINIYIQMQVQKSELTWNAAQKRCTIGAESVSPPAYLTPALSSDASIESFPFIKAFSSLLWNVDTACLGMISPKPFSIASS